MTNKVKCKVKQRKINLTFKLLLITSQRKHIIKTLIPSTCSVDSAILHTYLFSRSGNTGSCIH